ncbi:universal stress protein [Nitrosopumilus sp. K4]|uniref:universal stress protein n=1 Tax=Nitrosopumilus sp. K4 TaxID=2795383 RepID=UPI001BA9FEFB|nr:universal stress protein [Nitrosopumilus sp. K4]QUC65506.1 universal stress protein [Nitrosopumilus sp. K4]
MGKILVALDGSKNSIRGLGKAIEIAKADKSKIVGVNVVELPLSYFITRPKMEIKNNMAKKAKKIIEDAKKKCNSAGIDFESKIIPGGDIGYDIVKYAKKQKVNTIVIGARGLNPIKEMFLGSVSNYVLHKSKIPVLIVK